MAIGLSSLSHLFAAQQLHRSRYRWLDWLRAVLRWLLSPWQCLAALVRQISQLETVIAGHVATLQRLQTALDHDAPSGAYSRLFFLAALRQNIACFARNEHTLSGKSFSVGILDVDRFKVINDLYGHQVGDQALMAIVEQAHRLLRRDADVFARYGGDEFVFLLPQTPIQAACALADKLRLAVASLPASIGGQPITISIGLASCPDQGLTIHALLQAADSALYRAKVTRNAVCVAERA